MANPLLHPFSDESDMSDDYSLMQFPSDMSDDYSLMQLETGQFTDESELSDDCRLTQLETEKSYKGSDIWKLVTAVGEDEADEGKEKKGIWSPEEDIVLTEHVRQHGARHWGLLQSKGLLARKPKSCHFRWNSKLRPDLNEGKLSSEEVQIVLKMQNKVGNKWAAIAKLLNGRTANQVKNCWNSRKRRLERLAKHPLKLKSTAGNNIQLGTSQRSMLLGENLHLGENINHPKHPAYMVYMQTSPLITQQHPLPEMELQDITQMVQTSPLITQHHPLQELDSTENSFMSIPQGNQHLPLNVHPREIPFNNFLPLPQFEVLLGNHDLLPPTYCFSSEECCQKPYENVQNFTPSSNGQPPDSTMTRQYQPSCFPEMEHFYNFDYLPQMETVFYCPNLSPVFGDTNSDECGLQPTDQPPSAWPGSYGQQGLNNCDDANSSKFDSWIEGLTGECDISQYLNLDDIDPGPG